jgi:hypothetical protein
MTNYNDSLKLLSVLVLISALVVIILAFVKVSKKNDNDDNNKNNNKSLRGGRKGSNGGGGGSNSGDRSQCQPPAGCGDGAQGPAMYGPCSDYAARPKCAESPGPSEIAPCCSNSDCDYTNNSCWKGIDGSRWCIDQSSDSATLCQESCSNEGQTDSNCVKQCKDYVNNSTFQPKQTNNCPR